MIYYRPLIELGEFAIDGMHWTTWVGVYLVYVLHSFSVYYPFPIDCRVKHNPSCSIPSSSPWIRWNGRMNGGREQREPSRVQVRRRIP